MNDWGGPVAIKVRPCFRLEALVRGLGWPSRKAERLDPVEPLPMTA